MTKISDDSGESMESAIKISDVINSHEGILAEYQAIGMRFGTRGKDWELEIQFLSEKENRTYDILNIRLADGTKKSIYFDISDFFGK